MKVFIASLATFMIVLGLVKLATALIMKLIEKKNA